MTLSQSLVCLAVFGCIVYFPALVVTCVMQRREIARLRSMLKNDVNAIAKAVGSKSSVGVDPPYKLEPKGVREGAW